VIGRLNCNGRRTDLEDDVLLVDVLDRGNHVFHFAFRERDGTSTALEDRAITLQFRDSAELFHVK